MSASWCRGLKRTILVVFLLGITLSAEAVERQGFLIGFTVGGGKLDCDGCESSGAGGFGFHLGGSLSKKVTLAAELFAVAHDEDAYSFSDFQATALAQYWVIPRVWIGGGIGTGFNSVEIGNTTMDGDSKLALVAAAGVEIYQGRRFVLDLRGRYGRTATEPTATNHFVVMAGFTWY